MSNPKVIHVITRLIVGGAQENTILSCAGLRERGFDVTLVTGPEAGAEGSLLESARAAGIPVVVLKSMRRNPRPILDFIALVSLVRLFRRELPEIVHTHSSKAGILGRAAAWLAGVPVIIHTNHGLPFHDRQPWIVNRFWRFLETVVAPATTVFICVGETMKRASIAAGLAPAERHEVVYSGMDLVFDVRSARTGDPVIGWIGRLVPQKGPSDFIEMLELVMARHDTAQALIVGDGPLRAELESAVSRRPRVTFKGRVDPSMIPSCFAAMDVAVLTSYWEGLPRVAVQAALAGLPVVAYDVEGASEVVKSGETGFLVPVGDRRALADRVLEVLGMADLGRSMGAKGRALVADRFDGKRMVDELVRIYRERL